jgi:hypothetical protein
MKSLLRLFGIRDPEVPAGACHKDPVARYLDDEIDADEMDRELDRHILGMVDVVQGDVRFRGGG